MDPLAPPSLADSLVRLRTLADRDVDDVFAACQDREMARWTTVPVPYDRSDAEWFVDHAAQGWAGGQTLIFAITVPGRFGDRYCGAVDLRLDGAGAAEVGFGVAPWARGTGVGTAALRLVCAWGLDSLGLGRIEWLAHVGNDASRRMAEKVGFRPEGTQRAKCVARGVRHDAWVAGLLPGDLR